MSTLPVPAPDLPALKERIIAASLNGLSDNSRRVYSRHVSLFLNWLQSSRSTLHRESVITYLELNHRQKVSAYNQALSALKRLTTQAAENSWLSWPLARAIDGIPSKKLRGTPVGLWLNLEQARALIALPDTTRTSGLRDRAVLALLLGCGLRREEAASLMADQLQVRENRTMLIDVLGKGNRIRTITVPEWADAIIRQWLAAASISKGYLLRSFTPDGRINASLSASAVWDIVQTHTTRLGIACTPHDLRRTYARLSRKAKAPVETIQHSLGHASIATTERYMRTGEEANAGDYFTLS